MGKRVDYRRVKSHQTLTPQEWADRLGVTKNTILRWIKADGLEAIIDQKPYLIRGVDLKAFLKVRKKSKRFDCKTGEMACFACNKPRRPVGGMLDYTPLSGVSGRLTGLCEVCLTAMNRMIRQADIAKKFPDCDVTITRYQRTLSGLINHHVKGDIRSPSDPPENNTNGDGTDDDLQS